MTQHIRVLEKRECAYETCDRRTTYEGLLCRVHWDMIPGAVKESYVTARQRVLLAVYAAENLRKRDGL